MLFNQVEYQYALDSVTEQIIDVEELNEEDRKRVFICLGCENIVIPIMGKIQQWHFRHKVDIDSSCSGETYLHALAKKKLHEIYNKCLDEESEFYIEYKVQKTCTHYEKDYLVSCNLPSSRSKFDLTKYFDKIELEKKEGLFRPDLLLTSEKSNDKLFIEIAVTHASTKEKIESGNRIVEIFIRSEADIRLFQDRILSESYNIHFYNFLNRKLTGDFCLVERNCSLSPDLIIPVPYIFFIIYNNYESRLERKTFDELDKEMKNIRYTKNVCYPQDLFENLTTEKKNELYFKIIKQHFENGYMINNCSLCSKHRVIYHTSEAGYIFCNLHSKNLNSNEAASCYFYQSNPIKIGSSVRYIGGMIRYKDKMGVVVEISGDFYKCKFNGKFTESLRANELQLIKKILNKGFFV